MKEKLLNNLGMKILSIVFAMLIWLLVTNIDNPYIMKTYTDIPVTVINEEALLKKNKTWNLIEGETVTVTLKAKRNIMDKIKRSDIQATADLSKLSITNAVPIQVTVSKYDEELKEKNLGRIDTVKVKVENMATGQFPVLVDEVGEVGKGYAIGTKIPSPNIIEATGAESLIKRINQVKVTINVQDLVESKTFLVEPVYYNYDGDRLDSTRLRTKTKKVNVTVNLLKTKKVNLKVKLEGTLAKGYRLENILIEPKNIKVAGTKEQLANLSELTISKISVDELTQDIEENIDISDYLPEGIKLAQESNDVRVKLQVVPLEEKKFMISTNDIMVKNQSVALKRIFEEDELEIVVRGKKSQLDELRVEDLEANLDLDGLKSGKHKLNLQLKAIDGIYYEAIPKVKIILEKQENVKKKEKKDETIRE